MRTDYSRAQIERFIHTRYPDADAPQPLSGGLVSQTFAFASGGERFIFQIGGKREDYEKERYVSARYGAALPVRQVLWVDTVEEDSACCFSRYIPGHKAHDGDEAEREALVPALLELLETLASAALPPGARYGRYDPRGEALHPTWRAFVEAVYDPEAYRWDALESTGFDCAVAGRALAALSPFLPDLPLERPRLVHGDLGSQNLLTDGRRITGLIDWSLSLYGDPLYDIANFLFWNEQKLQPLTARLREEYLRVPDRRDRVYAYILRIALEEIYSVAARKEIGYDPGWMVGRLREVLDGQI